MPCRPIPGGYACSRGSHRKRCSVCSSRPATKLCDYPLRGAKAGRTCDAALCDRCAVRQGGGVFGQPETIDYCPAHARVAAAERGGVT